MKWQSTGDSGGESLQPETFTVLKNLFKPRLFWDSAELLARSAKNGEDQFTFQISSFLGLFNW
jgi:hypothetical protein